MVDPFDSGGWVGLFCFLSSQKENDDRECHQDRSQEEIFDKIPRFILLILLIDRIADVLRGKAKITGRGTDRSYERDSSEHDHD